MASPLTTLKNAKMKDMHVKPASKKEMLVQEESYKKPSIPYGLKISLDKDSLKNLGMSVKDFSVDNKMMLMAECEVCEVRSSKSTDYESENVELKITNMALAPKGRK